MRTHKGISISTLEFGVEGKFGLPKVDAVRSYHLEWLLSSAEAQEARVEVTWIFSKAN